MPSLSSRIDSLHRRIEAIPEASDVKTGLDYCPHKPWPKQQKFIDLPDKEAFFGGAAGGGKSDALLMAALQYVHVPGYSALILRRDYPRLNLPGAIMDRARSWLYKSDARWNGSEKRYKFPSGATIQFGYIDNPNDKFRYASSEFQFIGWDELTEFRLAEDEHNPYQFMYSRLRKTKDMTDVPLRMRSASNPGNIGHQYVRQRFISSEAEQAIKNGSDQEVYRKDGIAFIPSRIRDNPALDAAEYEQGLQHLPPVSRERLLNGDWTIQESSVIRSEWLRYYSMRGEMMVALDATGQSIGEVYSPNCQRFATIDTAGTEEDKAKEKSGKPASWSVCQIWDYWNNSGWLFLRHVWRKRVGWDGLKEGVLSTLKQWQPSVTLIENAHWGVPLSKECSSIPGVQMVSPAGKGKLARSVALQNQLEASRIYLPKASEVLGASAWLPELESEWLAWTGEDGETADQIDTASMAANYVSSSSMVWAGPIY